ncbi:MAG: YicC/YloC family endoribonuclease [Lautropia sp.]|nr:YicC/YloC family endoribonuclease [Lautropia sp.]
MQNNEIPVRQTPDGQAQPLNDSAPPTARAIVHSMTGYAHHTHDTPLGRVSLEIRAVNSRFTDLHFRLADEFRPLEPMLRAAISRHVRRGKLECRMNLNRHRDEAVGGVDETRLRTLLGLAEHIQRIVPNAKPPSVADYLRWLQHPEQMPGHGTEASQGPQDANTVWAMLAPMVDACLHDFQQTRQREGAALRDTLSALVEQMQAQGAQLRACLPELQAAAETRLLARLEKTLKDLPIPIPADETFARVRQEVSLLSLRDDITEELDRLDTHLAAVAEALAAGGPVGKRLDFLAQELNREANTIASKSMAIDITDTALALKLLIEQLREQVQNLE